MLAPLGLHFFLAYQEFVFYSFCSYYRSFAKRVLETSEEEETQPIVSAEGQKNILAYDLPREEAPLHSNLQELVDTMKNMTETFGPFLLQNFSLMLLYWLLHVYFIFFVAIQTIRNINDFLSDPFLVGLNCLQLAGDVLIVR